MKQASLIAFISMVLLALVQVYYVIQSATIFRYMIINNLNSANAVLII